MILLTAALAVLLACGVLAWRRHALVAHPARWPENISFDRQVGLLKAFLRRDGWTIGEKIPGLNVFVRAERDKLDAFLVIHNQHTMGLPMLLKDCMGKTLGPNVVIGIVSLAKLPDDLVADAARSGMYVLNPAELKNLAALIQKALARRRVLAAAGTGEGASVASSRAKSLQAQ